MSEIFHSESDIDSPGAGLSPTGVRPVDIVEFEKFKLSWLHTFVCICKLGTYSAAAKFLGISQPKVSRQIEALELWLGGQLLTNNRPPQLTDKGRTAYHMAERVLWDICDFNKLANRSLTRSDFTDQERENLRFLRIFTQEQLRQKP